MVNSYKRYPPKSESDNWIASATLIATGDWKDFHHLFFHPDGTFNHKFYKGSPPFSASDRDDCLTHATEIGARGWIAFQHLFFDHQGNYTRRVLQGESNIQP